MYFKAASKSTRSNERLSQNPNTGGFRGFFLPENDFKTCSAGFSGLSYLIYCNNLANFYQILRWVKSRLVYLCIQGYVVCNMCTCIDNIGDSQQKGKCRVNICTVASDLMVDLKKNSWNGGMSPMPTQYGKLMGISKYYLGQF